MRNKLLQAVRKHAEGHIEKHKVNVEVYLNQSVGIGEHSDIIEAIEIELEEIAKYQDQIDLLDTYFPQKKELQTSNGFTTTTT
jgi:predicted transcriptional regulator